MPPTPAPGDRSRPVVLVITLLSVCFVASSLTPQFQALAISSAAMDIAENSSPSIEHLASARADLHQLAVVVDDYLDARSAGTPADAAAVSAARARVETHLADYFRLPQFPGEHDSWAQLRRTVHRMDAALTRALAVGPEDEAVRRLRHEALRVEIDAAAAHMLELVDLNARFSHDRALLIRRMHVRALVLTGALDFLAVALASAAALLLRRALRRMAAVEAENARLLALRADELERYAGRMAHDVRNPLSAISLALAQAAGADAIPDVRRYVERARGSLGRAADIIRDLLEFARAGARPLESACADLRAVVAGVVADLRPAAEARGVSLTVAPLPACSVACAPGVLTSIVANLAQNSIKYIGEGPERCVTVRGAERDGRVRLEVEDTGTGIEPGLHGMIFEPFVRGGDWQQPGLGLGLATVKRICETHAGRVGLESAPGRGSLFWVELPAAP